MVQVLIKDKVILSPKRGQKPTKFRFRGNIRFGLRRGKVVEVVKFKKLKGRRK